MKNNKIRIGIALILLSIISQYLLRKFLSFSAINNPLVTVQAPLQALLKPAGWSKKIKSLHQAKTRHWNLQTNKGDSIETILTTSLIKAGIIPKSPQVKGEKILITGWFITKNWGWLDLISLEISPSKKSKFLYKVKANSHSTGLFPLTVLLAPILNIFTFFFPFLDHGTNDRTLDSIFFAIPNSVKTSDDF